MTYTTLMRQIGYLPRILAVSGAQFCAAAGRRMVR